MSSRRIRVLLIPDSVYWVLGTIAKAIARYNPWIEATIASGSVIDAMCRRHPELMHNFDLVHFLCPYTSREWLPRFCDYVPCVTSHHHVTDWNLVKHNLYGDAIVVGSSEWAADLRTRGADMTRVFCVPYGVNADVFLPPTLAERRSIRTKHGIPETSVVVGFFGKNSSNDDDRKGIGAFVEGVLGLHRLISNLTIVIVGPGWRELVDRFAAGGIRCIWLPFVRDSRGLAEIYHGLDFYWITARVEGGPVTLLEAMSSGVCCVTTPVGLARDIVRDNVNAILVPFDDVGAFISRTAALVRDAAERQRLARNGRRTILTTMQARATSRLVRGVYEKAFANFASRRQYQARGVINCDGRLPVVLHDLVLDDTEELDSAAVPLEGFPARVRRRVRMLEGLAWSEHLLLYHHELGIASRLIIHEWLSNPFSLEPPRVLLRRFLPASIVERVVRLKNGQRSLAHLAKDDPLGKKA